MAVVDIINTLTYRGQLFNNLGRTSQTQLIYSYYSYLILAADVYQQCNPLYNYGIDLAKLG